VQRIRLRGTVKIARMSVVRPGHDAVMAIAKEHLRLALTFVVTPYRLCA